MATSLAFSRQCVATIASFSKRVWAKTQANTKIGDLCRDCHVAPAVEVVDKLRSLVTHVSEVFKFGWTV